MANRRRGPSEALSSALVNVMREARVACEISQAELAQRTGLHRTYISLLERGARKPTVEVLERIARALDLRASTLLARAERSASPKMRG